MISSDMYLSYEVDLERLLEQNIEDVCERAGAMFDNQTWGKSSLVLFGAGSLGRKTLNGLRKIGIEPLAFADNNPKIWGTCLDGIKILDPRDAAKIYGASSVFVVTIWNPDSQEFLIAQRQLITLGCKAIVSFVALFFKYPSVFLPHYALAWPKLIHENRNKVMDAFRLFEETDSLADNFKHIEYRLTGDLTKLPQASVDVQYFPPFLGLMDNEVFVDCGAYDGDTIDTFINHCPNTSPSIYAFEPDPLNYRKLVSYITNLSTAAQQKIQCFQNAVGAKQQKLLFSATGTPGASLGCGNYEVECVRLDDVLENEKPTYIKMDIEGAELDAIDGVRNLIEASAPALAVCVYHRPYDLWEIPLLINNIRNDYTFFLRTHREQGWEAVLYAIPSDRVDKYKAL